MPPDTGARSHGVSALLVLSLLLVVALGSAFNASPARADVRLFGNLGCGTRHATDTFEIDAPDIFIHLYVKHDLGRWGQVVVRDRDTEAEFWSFRQPYSWISGSYSRQSPKLPAGRYRVD